MPNILKYLDWDSHFFSMNIASISMNTFDEPFLKSSIDKLRLEKIDLIYLFLNGNILLPQSFPYIEKCLLVDTKRIYGSQIMEDESVDSHIELYSGSPDDLYDLAIQAGVDSRYRLDANFAEGEFERLYRTWIENSLNGEVADYVLAYSLDSLKVGFITLRKSDCISIGLIATDKSYRRLGVGSALLNAAKHYAFINHLPLEVATQVHNEPACLFYEKNGFEKKKDISVYHIWLN